jgi:hypothetical protein
MDSANDRMIVFGGYNTGMLNTVIVLSPVL